MRKFLLILLFAIALSTQNEADIPETTKSKWFAILEKFYNIFYSRLPVNLKKAVSLSRKDKTWEKFILKLERVGERHAVKICLKNYIYIPHPKPGEFNPVHYPGLCTNLVNKILIIIKRFNKEIKNKIK